MFYFKEKLSTDRDKLRNYQIPTIEELKILKPNAAGSRWTPVPHIELIEMIERVLNNRGYEITSEQYQHGYHSKLKKINTHNLFGYFTIRGNLSHLDGFERVLAFRHSNVQDFGIKILSGAKVTLCSNGIANGEHIVNRKHTSGVSLHSLINEAVTAWEDQQGQLAELVQNLENAVITPEQASFILVNAAVQDIVSSDKIVPIYKEYLDPEYEEWQHPTGWCLLQAVTQTAKSWGLARQENSMHRFPVFILECVRAFNSGE